MKKVAGSLKLALAQFRELEAFAQFASDLDADTKRQIDRGRRMTELLKQLQFQPLSVELQVMSIYAASNGYFDDVEVSDIQATEASLLAFMQSSKSELLKKIAGGDWSKETEAEVKAACEEFKK